VLLASGGSMNHTRPPEVVCLLARHCIGDVHGESIGLALNVFGKIYPALISTMHGVIVNRVKLCRSEIRKTDMQIRKPCAIAR
jgi:hypothetical protein